MTELSTNAEIKITRAANGFIVVLENPMYRGAWQAMVHRVAKESDTTEAT